MNSDRISGLHGPIMLTTHSARKIISGAHIVIPYLYHFSRPLFHKVSAPMELPYDN